MPLVNESTDLPLPLDPDGKIVQDKSGMKTQPRVQSWIPCCSSSFGQEMDTRRATGPLVDLSKENEEVSQLKAASGRACRDLTESVKKGDQVLRVSSDGV